MGKVTYRPHRAMTSFTCTVDDVYRNSLSACTTGYSMTYNDPVRDAKCSYCGTRYYLVAGDRMNCTQCGAPI